jgi:hypothetical protein
MSGRRWLNSTTMLSGVVGGVFLSTMCAGAAELYVKAPLAEVKSPLSGPAVDGFNWKADIQGGSIVHESLFGARGSLSFPLDYQFGAQIDLQAGSLGGDGYAGIAGHLFWRDPGRGLIGAYVAHTYLDRFGGAYVTQVAGEGEYYWRRFTVQAIAGVEFGNTTSSTTTTTTVIPQGGFIPGVTTTAFFTEGFNVKTRFFDQINLKYYLTDNWAGYVGHRFLGGKGALALGTEWAFPVKTNALASAFVEARVGEHDFQGIWGGLRIYYGQHDKTLIERQRQDDPTYWDTLFSILNSYYSNSGSSSSQFCTIGFLYYGYCEGGVD